MADPHAGPEGPAGSPDADFGHDVCFPSLDLLESADLAL